MVVIKIKIEDIETLQHLLKSYDLVVETTPRGVLISAPFTLSWDANDEISLTSDHKEEG